MITTRAWISTLEMAGLRRGWRGRVNANKASYISDISMEGETNIICNQEEGNSSRDEYAGICMFRSQFVSSQPFRAYANSGAR